MRSLCLALLLAALPALAADDRPPADELYRRFEALRERGWILEVVAQSQPPGTTAPMPIIALRTPATGPAVWILAGVHGEEPAGPNAVAEALDDIAALGAKRPVVLLPLLNPQGYARSWRYLNTPVYSESIDGQSVGDSSHLLPSSDAPERARAAVASSPEADAVTGYVVAKMADYPPLCSIDLHEDNLIDQGYVYSQGAEGAADPLARAAVEVLQHHGIPIKMDGTTRFDEPIAGGIVGPVTDSSIDELFSSPELIDGGQRRPGPAAHTVLVFETPAAALPLSARIAAHAALLRRLVLLLAPAPDG